MGGFVNRQVLLDGVLQLVADEFRGGIPAAGVGPSQITLIEELGDGDVEIDGVFKTAQSVDYQNWKAGGSFQVIAGDNHPRAIELRPSEVCVRGTQSKSQWHRNARTSRNGSSRAGPAIELATAE